MPGWVHHIQWSVCDIEKTCKTLSNEFGFIVIASRKGEVVLRAGKTVFLLSQKNEVKDLGRAKVSAYPRIDTFNSVQNDTVFNICLEVDDVASTFTSMVSNGSTAILPPETLYSLDGNVIFALVSSPCPNVLHSLVNTSQFKGAFLPGFINQKQDEEDNIGLTYMDHLTYVCTVGQAEKILSWYQKTCGMAKFRLKSEDEERGLEVTEGGLRLRVGEWLTDWLCREVGVASTNEETNFKLVLAEPLSNEGNGHVNRSGIIRNLLLTSISLKVPETPSWTRSAAHWIVH